MKIIELLKALEGIQTIKSVMLLLNADKKKAIYYVHRLRKAGYVKTSGASNKTRVYHISLENRLQTQSYYDVINRYAPIGINPLEETRIYGKEITPEEAIVFAIKANSVRVIIAALALFRKIRDWALLSRLAKGELKRQVCALYDVAKTIMRVRKMPKRFKNTAAPHKEDKYAYIIPGLSSDNFKGIEKAWKVYLPLNKADLEDYR
ncbi:MAG TPA: hypothetical protein HA362_04840 [Nanoarchaeota archaeon]|nr:hypothetical protein [Nanoarchaeota archaeon]